MMQHVHRGKWNELATDPMLEEGTIIMTTRIQMLQHQLINIMMWYAVVERFTCVCVQATHYTPRCNPRILQACSAAVCSLIAAVPDCCIARLAASILGIRTARMLLHSSFNGPVSAQQHRQGMSDN